MKKFYIAFISFLTLYGIGISYYLFQMDHSLPEMFVGSAADPSTFMTSEQLRIATLFSRLKYFLFFMGVPWEWAIYFIVLGAGLSPLFFILAKKVSKKSFLGQTAIYVFLLSLFVALLQLPLQYYSYKLSRDYGINIQPFSSWIGDKGKSFLINIILTIPMVWLLYVIINKSPKKWWFWFWLISVPLTIMLFFVQPVVIDPVFNDFQSLQDRELREEILSLAHKADVPTEQVYQVNMSEKTKSMNAYVTGIGSNARIVLWDTTLNKLTNDEILFIMAHEIAHYVYRHIYWMLFGTIASSFALSYIVYRLVNWIVRKYGSHWGISRVGDLRSLPLLLLIVSVLSFTISPIENTISRQSERAADKYAIEMMGDKESAIRSFQKLTVESLSEPNPPELVKIFLYSHPTMVERLYTISSYDGQKE